MESDRIQERPLDLHQGVASLVLEENEVAVSLTLEQFGGPVWQPKQLVTATNAVRGHHETGRDQRHDSSCRSRRNAVSR